MRESFETKPGDSFEKAPVSDVTSSTRTALGRLATSAAQAKDTSTQTALGRTAVTRAADTSQVRRAEAARPLGQLATSRERKGRTR